MAIKEIAVPEIGGAEGVEVIEILVQPGDEVDVDSALIVLESDKASMEIPSPAAGKVVELKLKSGDKVAAGSPMLTLEVAGEAPESEPAQEKPAPAAAEPASTASEAPASAAPAPASGPTVERIRIPDIGTSDAVDVIEVLVKEGDRIAEGDSLVVLESDKASMEVPAPKGGVVRAVLVQNGDKVTRDADLIDLETEGTTAPAGKSGAATEPPAGGKEPSAAKAPSAAKEPSAAKAPSANEPPAPKQSSAVKDSAAPRSERSKPAAGGDVYAGPAVRRLAREMGIDLVRVSGSGPKGRIQKDDVKQFVKDLMEGRGSVAGAIPAVPEVDFAAFGPVEVEPLTKLNKLTAANMQRAWLNVPHVTQFDEVDVTELEAFRDTVKAEAERQGAKVTPLPFILKACAAALRAHPKFNASLANGGEDLVLKQYVHIGVAVDTPAGLVVPVIRDVDRKSIYELARESAELAEKARSRKLKPDEMQGGCFSISSLGNIGGQGFTPIINTPEVAILAVSRLTVKPVWDGAAFQPRKMLPLSLSYDHRVVNGADAGRFFSYLNTLLGDVRRLLL